MNTLFKETWVAREKGEWWWIIVLAFLYAISGLAGLYFSGEALNVTPIWPPLGVAVAILYLRGMQLWPGILLGEISLQLLLGFSFQSYYNVILSNLLSGIAVALILRNSDFNPTLSRLKDLIILLVPAGLSAVLINGLVGAIPSIFFGKYHLEWISGFTSLFLWVAGDYLSVLLITALILHWTCSGREAWSRAQAGEWFALIFSLLVVLGYIFLVDNRFLTTGLPASFLVFPLLIWAGMRFGVQGVLLANFFTTGIAMIGFSQTLQNLDSGYSPILFTIFLLTSQIAALFLAVINEARRSAERQVQGRELFLRQILDFLPSGILIKNAENRVLFVNRFWAEVFGEAQSRIEGSVHRSEEILPENEPLPGKGHWIRPVLSRKDRGQRKMAFIQRSIPLDRETRPGTLIHMDDQTEILEAREKMRIQQSRLTAAIEGADIGLWEWDIEERKFKREPSWFHVLGYREDEFDPAEDPWEKIIHPEDRNKGVDFYLDRLNAKGNSFETEYRLRHKTGEFIWVAARGIVTERNKLGEPLKVMGIIFNISQMKYVELELRKAKESAESASEAKSYFLANITHEIRTPLNAIMGMASILKDTQLDSEQLDYVWTIIQGSENLTSLISEVLDFSKIESGNFELDIQEFPLRVCCEDAAGLFENRLKEHHLEFFFDLDPEVDQYYLGDAQRLRQILLNLIGNAVKFTTGGKIHLRIRRADLNNIPEAVEDILSNRKRYLPTEDTEFVLFEVEDTGIGIPQDQQQKIFDSFTQGDPSTTRKYGGTGLGLTISKNLTEAMGGAIWVESQAEQGTTFSFIVELGKIRTPEAAAGHKEMDRKAHGDNHLHSGVSKKSQMALDFPCRILIAEDNETNQRVLKTLLNQFGYRPACVKTGREACELLQKKGFDLIFMDIRMPDMDGLEATRFIRKQFSRDRQPTIVALTAHVVQGEKEKCLLSGMDDFVPKPITTEMLKRTVQTYAASRKKI